MEMQIHDELKAKCQLYDYKHKLADKFICILSN